MALVPSVDIPSVSSLDVLFAIDTTGSMREEIDAGQLKSRLGQAVERLLAGKRGTRVALLCHGDLCERPLHGYTCRYVDFTDNAQQLVEFVKKMSGTRGDDKKACYELVLRQVADLRTWQADSQKLLVLLGDKLPHDLDDLENITRVNWQEETCRLFEDNGVRVCAVQCGNSPEATTFYRHLAVVTGGCHIHFSQLPKVIEALSSDGVSHHSVTDVQGSKPEVQDEESKLDVHVEEFQPLTEIDMETTTGAGLPCIQRSLPIQGTDNTPVFEDISPDHNMDEDDDIENHPSDAVRQVLEPASPLKVGEAVSPRPSECESSSETDSDSELSDHDSTAIRTARNRLRSRSPLRPRQEDTVRRVRRRAGLLSHKKRKREYRPRPKAFERMMREAVTSDNFILADLSWSPWTKAITRKAPSSVNWEPRPGGHVGFRRRHLYDNLASRAVYEVAVQPPDSTTKVPVVATATSGFSGRHWEGALLSKPKVRAQIDRVLKRGCKLYVRRASVSRGVMDTVNPQADAIVGLKRADKVKNLEEAVGELRSMMGQLYDYAWRDHYDIESRTYSHRPIVVNGCKVSD